ncbi:hypothetical protein U1Q18_034202 [Sarracenia purpurea var. burkii]
MDDPYPPKEVDVACQALSAGRSGMEHQPIVEKVEKGAFFRSRVGTSPLPSALDNTRDVQNEEEIQQDDDINSIQGPIGAPVGFAQNLEKLVGVEYQSLPSSCTLCKAFGHATDKCKTHKQADGDEGWTQVGRDKGKAPVQASPVPEICEELAPSKAAELSKEDPSSSRAREEAPIPDNEIPIPEKESPNPETSFLEKDARSAANEQVENQPDTKVREEDLETPGPEISSLIKDCDANVENQGYAKIMQRSNKLEDFGLLLPHDFAVHSVPLAVGHYALGFRTGRRMKAGLLVFMLTEVGF